MGAVPWLIMSEVCRTKVFLLCVKGRSYGLLDWLDTSLKYVVPSSSHLFTNLSVYPHKFCVIIYSKYASERGQKRTDKEGNDETNFDKEGNDQTSLCSWRMSKVDILIVSIN